MERPDALKGVRLTGALLVAAVCVSESRCVCSHLKGPDGGAGEGPATQGVPRIRGTPGTSVSKRRAVRGRVWRKLRREEQTLYPRPA